MLFKISNNISKTNATIKAIPTKANTPPYIAAALTFPFLPKTKAGRKIIPMAVHTKKSSTGAQTELVFS